MRAIITGVGGMDGTYLSKYLLEKGYEVIGITRRSSTNNSTRLEMISDHPNFTEVFGDVTDAGSINSVVSHFQPDEFYHLAANSFVGTSWASPSHVIDTNTIGTINCLEALRQHKKDCRFYFAGSSEMYGDLVKRSGTNVVLTEDSPMMAASPYGVSKVAGYQMTHVYRESYDMFASCGILFNHSSPLRGEEFFTRKVTSQLSRVYWGLQDQIVLGNLDASRDEGNSEDYVRAMHLMLQHDQPDDFVIATGETHSCREWVQETLRFFNLQENVVTTGEKFLRPNEVNILLGDASKAQSVLGWTPDFSFKDLIEGMCSYDYHLQSIKPKVRAKASQYLLLG